MMLSSFLVVIVRSSLLSNSTLEPAIHSSSKEQDEKTSDCKIPFRNSGIRRALNPVLSLSTVSALSAATHGLSGQQVASTIVACFL